MSELNERQSKIIEYLRQNPGSTAGAIAESCSLGDSRGVAQTIRHMPMYVVRRDDKTYKLTGAGLAAA